MSEEQSTITYKTIPRFPGYRFGDDGSVWSLWVRMGGPNGGRPAVLGTVWRRFKISPNLRYPRVKLREDSGRRIAVDVHRLILEAFVGPCPEGMEALHADDDGHNNSPTNLRWGTQLENAGDAVRNGRTVRGERIASAKLTPEKVAEMRERYAKGGVSMLGLARAFGVSKSQAHRIVRAAKWGHI